MSRTFSRATLYTFSSICVNVSFYHQKSGETNSERVPRHAETDGDPIEKAYIFRRANRKTDTLKNPRVIFARKMKGRDKYGHMA